MTSEMNSDKEFNILELGVGKKCVDYYFVNEPHPVTSSDSEKEWFEDERTVPKLVNLQEQSTFKLPLPAKKIKFKEDQSEIGYFFLYKINLHS